MSKEPTLAKKLLLDLVKTPYDKPFRFTVSIGEGTKLIQQIRVEMSRVRYEMDTRGKPKKSFKIQRVSIIQGIENETVTLMRKRTVTNEVYDAIDRIKL